MRGFSLTQPWATLVAAGEKGIETRSWSTAYRGEVLIHAAKRFPRECRELCWQQPFASALIRGKYVQLDELPRGVIVAVAELVRVDETKNVRDRISDQELAFGDYGPERFAWWLQRVRPLREPVPCK